MTKIMHGIVRGRLNNGVVLNIAPLDELVPWKKAKKYWHERLEGKYDCRCLEAVRE